MRRNTNLMTAAAVLLACVASSLAQDAGKVQFRLRLQPGQMFRSETVTRQATTQSIMGNEQKMDQTIGMAYRYEVLGVAPDGTAMIKVTYDALKMAMDGPTGKIDYDSKNPPAEIPAQAKGMAALLGQSIRMQMNSQGRVTKVEDVEALLDRIIAQIDLPDETVKAAITTMLKKQFGNDAMIGTMQSMMATYPEAPVGVGDSWTSKANVTAGIPMQTESTYTLKSRSGGMATLGVQTKIQSNPDAEPMAMGPMKMTYNISGTQRGEMVVHEMAGWTISSKLTMEFKGDVKASGIPGMADGTSWPISCTGEVTVTTTK